MSFTSVNELDRFSYRDCILKNFSLGEDIVLDLEALIVEPNNSANTNFTKSYAGDTTLTLKGGKLLKAIKDGYKYYDANDTLIEAIPDEEIEEATFPELIRSFKDVYLYDIQIISDSKCAEDAAQKDAEQTLVLGIEFMPTDKDDLSEQTDSYQLKISYRDAIVTWQKYMNRVEQ